MYYLFIFSGFLKQLRSTAACVEENEELEEGSEEEGHRGGAMATIAKSCEQSHVTGGANQISHTDHKTVEGGEAKKDSNGQSSGASVTSTISQVPYCRSLHKFEHKYADSEQTSGARPKSSKILKRKNTPAVLPKVERLYGKW